MLETLSEFIYALKIRTLRGRGDGSVNKCCCPSMRTRVQAQATMEKKAGMVAPTCNSSSEEVEIGGPWGPLARQPNLISEIRDK